jgi:hypothetical protein
MRPFQEVALDLFDERGFEDVTIEQRRGVPELGVPLVWDQGAGRASRRVRVLRSRRIRGRFAPACEGVETGDLAGDDRLLSSTTMTSRGAELAIRSRSPAYGPHLPDQAAQGVADALARATGRRSGELDVQVIASVLVWSLVAAVRHRHAGGYTSPLEEEFDRALTLVESGMQLNEPPTRVDPPG